MSNERQQRAARAEQMRKEREKADRKQRNVITIAIVAVVIVLVGVGGYAIKSENDKNKQATALTTPANATKDYSVVYTPEIATGKPAAAGATKPVVITMYEDFLCPGCGAFEEANSAFLKDAVTKGEVTLEYRPFAFLTTSSTNEYSQRAANAAVCVLDKGGVPAYVKMHDILYQNRPEEGTAGPEDDALIGFAKQAGVTGIDSCINTQKFTPWVEDALKAGRDNGVTGTPTIRINNKDVNGPEQNGNPTIPQPADMQKAIDAAKA